MTNEDGWSRPSLYTGRGRAVEPRTFTEADPIAAVLVADWSGDQAHATWSDTTYIGPRRKRPAAGGDALDPPASAEADAGVAADVGVQVEAESADDNRQVLANSRAMAVATLVSRVTGFLRNSLLVAALGTHLVGDSYNLANNLPNMVYELLLGGVLSSVLVPLLVHAQQDDPDRGVAYTQRLLSIATAVLGGLTLLAVACAPLLAAGFVHAGPQRSLTSILATLLLPEIFFYGLGAMFMAVLNVRNSYAPGAWSPVLNNVVMIATVVVFWSLPGPDTLDPSSITTAQILVLGIGTTLGIVAQSLVLVPAMRRTGFHWKWRFRAHPNEVGRLREVGRLGFWVLGYVVASQVGVTVIAKVGVANHAFTTFTNADLLIQMPYGILVVSLLTALMPRLSRAAAREDQDEAVARPRARRPAVRSRAHPDHRRTDRPGPGLVHRAVRLRTDVGRGRPPDRHRAGRVGVRAVPVRHRHVATAGVLRDARRSHAHAHQRVHGRDQGGDRACLRARVHRSGEDRRRADHVHLSLVRRRRRDRPPSAHPTARCAALRARVPHDRPGALASGVGALAAFGVGVLVQGAFGHERTGAVATLVLGSLAGLAVLAVVVWRLRISEIDDVLAFARRR